MKITSGLLGGRLLRVPAHPTLRPTQDRVRQAVFSSLGDLVAEARVLDLFAGTGSLGLEAWSRGAAAVIWVESDRRVAEALEASVRELCRGGEGAGTAEVVRMDVYAFLERQAPGRGPFDLVLADPPYDRGAGADRMGKTLRALGAGSILSSRGLLVFEMAADDPVAVPPGWTWMRDKRYGGTRVIMGRPEPGKTRPGAADERKDR
jgi:16S rRNA (guanine966-N2)-methyltransferase